MTVQELKKIIKNLPNDMKITLEGDKEIYSQLVGFSTTAIYIPETTWYGNAYSPNWTAEDSCMSNDEWEKVKKNERSLLFFINP